MAALDRRNPNLDDFIGLNWSSWIDRANILPSEGSIVEECNKYGKKRTETMTLRKEDMSIYGHCPAHDDFYLVVCSRCGLVVKPQAFEKHCESCHGPPGKLCGPPSPGRPPSLAPPSRERQDSRHQGAAPPSTTPSLPQHRPAKAQKEGVGLAPPAQESPPSPLHPSPRRPKVPTWHSGPQPPDGPPSSASEKTSALPRVATGQPEDTHTSPRGTKTYSRTFKKVYKKECDLDKHCGVLDPERKKLCTRQLMCNIHSIHQRRKVVGRSKTFDQLVTEQRTGSKCRDLERPSPKDPSPHEEAPEDPTGPQHRRHALNNCAILRSREPSESGGEEEEEEEEGESAVEVEVQPPYPFNQSLPSSEGSDSEDQEEDGDLPATPWHPKPLGLCTFGSRPLGCSVFTFDRRLHHIHFALSAMVEHHLSAHLWKKIPQVTGVRSRQAPTTASTATGSSGRVGGVPAPPTGPSLRSPPPSLPHRAAGRENCSGQSETQSNQRKPPSAKPLSSTPRPPARPRNPVGRPSKARLREQERSKPPHGEAQAPPKRVRDHPLQERGRPQGPARVYPSPSSQGPINGAVALGKKPCPPQSQPSGCRLPSPGQGKRHQGPPLRPPHPPPRGRGRPPGLHRRLVSYDQRDLAKKRKSGGGASPLPVSPPPTRAPKSRCLSSPSHSSLLSWRGESMGGALARGLEKRKDPQRPKVQH